MNKELCDYCNEPITNCHERTIAYSTKITNLDNKFIEPFDIALYHLSCYRQLGGNNNGN